jgi:hypothetical protein
MNIQLIRKAMLKVNKNCTTGIMQGKDNVSLIWRLGSHWTQEFISKKDCKVDSPVFIATMEGARRGLMY